MANIVLTVKDKIASVPQDAYIVCGNNKYTLILDLDEEWEIGKLITVRFKFCKNGKLQHIDRTTFTDTVTIPEFYGINQVFVGLFSGDIQTTTPARVLCLKSITCDDSTEIGANGSRDAEAIEQLKSDIGILSELDTDNKESLVLAINELYQSMQYVIDLVNTNHAN